MPKCPLVILVLMFPAFLLGAGREWTAIRSTEPGPAVTELVFSTPETSIIRFSIDGFMSKSAQTPKGPAVVVGLKNAFPIMIAGAPDLPKMAGSVVVPDRGEMRVEVLEAAYREYDHVLIAPSRGNLTRNIDPAAVPLRYGPAYEKNAFFPGRLAELGEPYVLRDCRGQAVVVYPFQYNPATQVLRVYHDLKVRVVKVGEQGLNPLVRVRPVDHRDGQFQRIYARHFLNYAPDRPAALDPGGDMLIISYGPFMEFVQPYLIWKMAKGRNVTMVDVATIGNSAAIKSYIADYYRTHDLTYVLLVGDADQVPASATAAGDSDNDYAYVAGDDHYPDIFVGRFSAENTDEVRTQVTRSLLYENPHFKSQAEARTAVGLASEQGPGDNGEYDYEHVRNINAKLLNTLCLNASELFDGSQGGSDAEGDPGPEDVAQIVNAGPYVINYTGHGSTTSWGTSGFSSSDALSLTNNEAWPFIWAVACVNGDFVNGTCFAEAWLRASTGGLPAGAAAFLGSTINQYWDPPMCAQDEMNDLLVEAAETKTACTFGALSVGGFIKMNDVYGIYGQDMTDTWTCFGDPSLIVYFPQRGFPPFPR
jgi:hypothetical protein